MKGRDPGGRPPANDPNDPRERLRRIVEALDEEPPGEDEAREVVAALGVDVAALAERIRRRAREIEAATPDARALLLAGFEAARVARRRAPEPVRPRAEQIARIHALMARAEQVQVAAHFRKLEDAGDDELAALLGSLRDLLEPPGDSGDEGPER
jgi:hypothetical protein